MQNECFLFVLKRGYRCLLCIQTILFFNHQAKGQNYIFARLNGTPLNTAGWNLQGDARVTNVTGTGNSELLICSVNGASGAAFFNQPINLTMCSKWKAEFDFRMADGTGADGLAFCFLDVPPEGFMQGAGLGIPKTANGLKICFDTWNNCIPFNSGTVHQDMPKIEIRWGNGYDECSGQPTRSNADGEISFIHSPNYQHAAIYYDNGNIKVFVNDSLYLSGYQQFNFTGYLGFTASTGGYTDNHSIKNVIIYTEMPPSNAGSSQSFCPSDTVQIGSASNPAYSYSWYPSEGLSSSTVSAPLLHLSNDSAATASHVYYVKTSYSNNPGCSSLDSVTVNVFPNPKVQFLTPAICLTDALARFTDSSFTSEPTTLPFLYQWNFGDPAAQPGNTDSSTLQNPSHLYDATGNYSIRLKVSNARGCTDSLSKIFTVNGAVPKAGFTIRNETRLCSNRIVVLTNHSTVDFGSITKVQVFWGDSSAVSYIDDHPFEGKEYLHQYPKNDLPPGTGYTVRMIAFSGKSCGNELSRQVTILPSPEIRFNPADPVCDNSAAFSITKTAQVSGLEGSFAYTGKGISPDGSFKPGVAGHGTDSVLFKFTATNGCMDSGYQAITVLPSPAVNAGTGLYVLKNESTLINATASGSGLQYKWYPPVYLNNDTILTPVSTPSEDILYTLVVTDDKGCSNQSAVSVKLLHDPLIPNAFTPNGDGLNDSWGIEYLSFYPNCDISIYNRFGQMVFHSLGYKQPWDGTFRGQPMPAGIYCYIIDTKKQKKLFTGILTLIR